MSGNVRVPISWARTARLGKVDRGFVMAMRLARMRGMCRPFRAWCDYGLETQGGALGFGWRAPLGRGEEWVAGWVVPRAVPWALVGVPRWGGEDDSVLRVKQAGVGEWAYVVAPHAEEPRVVARPG